ncbi:sensor histidine kinase [Hyalangium versicolor]|uniref:sensor histidine kinase n=1 Tax=Hyalangium versicolor TaxID=2861190 RepID=UPI001CCD6E3C|nr:HAMP domain-containing sensor histidine kinase [Hyalangium versicolor]
MSLRSLLTGVAGAILLLALAISTALVTITKRMERDSLQLGQTVESVRAAEEIEIALLLHSHEQQLLELTGDAIHATVMSDAEKNLQHWLTEARKFIGSSEEASILQELTRNSTEYLAIEQRLRSQGRTSIAESLQSLDKALDNSKRLVKINIDDARRVAEETRQWDELANRLGLILVTALFLGLGVVLWSIRRYAYQPLLSIRDALVDFRPGARDIAVPETGALELREIAREFNDMARRLAHHREVQLGFIAGVAHDLRNPLSALKLSAATVRQDRPLPPEDKLRERFVIVIRQVERIERMVEDLLDTARIEAGKLELRMEEHDLRGLLQEGIALHEETSSHHTLVLQVPEEPVLVRYDSTRISQVLNNLVNNAIKYSPEGGQVRVALSTEGDSAWVAVTDSGVGIPESERESIFEPFRRSAATRDTIPGVGLGLAVSRRIIEAHGGQIEVESTPGAGSTFRFRLPLEPRPGT